MSQHHALSPEERALQEENKKLQRDISKLQNEVAENNRKLEQHKNDRIALNWKDHITWAGRRRCQSLIDEFNQLSGRRVYANHDESPLVIGCVRESLKQAGLEMSRTRSLEDYGHWDEVFYYDVTPTVTK